MGDSKCKLSKIVKMHHRILAEEVGRMITCHLNYHALMNIPQSISTNLYIYKTALLGLGHGGIARVSGMLERCDR